MSTERCKHGNVVADTMGDYRCYVCEPLGVDDIADHDQRLVRLEDVVRELAERNGIIWPEIP